MSITRGGVMRRRLVGVFGKFVTILAIVVLTMAVASRGRLRRVSAHYPASNSNRYVSIELIDTRIVIDSMIDGWPPEPVRTSFDSENTLRNEDFPSLSNPHQILGFIYLKDDWYGYPRRVLASHFGFPMPSDDKYQIPVSVNIAVVAICGFLVLLYVLWRLGLVRLFAFLLCVAAMVIYARADIRSPGLCTDFEAIACRRKPGSVDTYSASARTRPHMLFVWFWHGDLPLKPEPPFEPPNE